VRNGEDVFTERLGHAWAGRAVARLPRSLWPRARGKPGPAAAGSGSTQGGAWGWLNTTNTLMIGDRHHPVTSRLSR